MPHPKGDKLESSKYILIFLVLPILYIIQILDRHPMHVSLMISKKLPESTQKSYDSLASDQ